MTTRRGWLKLAIGISSIMTLPACYQAYVIVHIQGMPVNTMWLQLRVTVGSLHAVDLYPPDDTELSFYLPAGSEGQLLNITVNALDADGNILAKGTEALNFIETKIRYSTAIALT